MTRNFAVKAVHKQMYPATYNFRDEDNGDEPSDWTTNNDANTTTTIIAILDGHKKVLQLYDNNGAGKYDVEIDFDFAQTSGTIELWFHTTDNTLDHILQLLQADNVIAIQVDLNAIAGVGDDTWYHYKIIFDCATDTYEHWLDDASIAAGVGFTNAVTNIITIKFIGTDADSGYYNYADAIGTSWDTDYKIGDNGFWRHYKGTFDFESDDVGDEPSGWVSNNGANCTTTVEPFFNEHKKVLQLHDNGGASLCEIDRDFSSGQTTGTIEFWWNTNDITKISNFYALNQTPAVSIQIANDTSEFWYQDGAWKTVGLPTTNNHWYHFKLPFNCATDTYDIIIDNIAYKTGVTFQAVATTLDSIRMSTFAGHSGYSAFFDAVSFSWDNDIADNRIFDYNDTYTREVITSEIENILLNNSLHRWRGATLFTKTDYENTEIFLQIYDINSNLGMEAEIINRVQKGVSRTYILLDKNYDDLNTKSSNTFSSAKLHDPTDATSILKVILPNIGEADGDLILVNGDTKSNTYSPVTKNYPDYEMLTDISDLSDSVVIIKANGKCYLDDDLASGESLDFDVEADKGVFIAPPEVNDILDTINYFEIFGAMNPDTGERFYKIIDNSNGEKKRKWRITNNSFRTQTDVDNYATALSTKVVPVRQITINVQGLGAHDMGTTFDFKYIDGIFDISQGNYYIIRESLDLDTMAATIVLSEGLLERSKYAGRIERPQNYSDTDWAEIYDTDINTVYPDMKPYKTATTGAGASADYGIRADALFEGVVSYIIIDEKVDTTRDIELKWAWTREDANADTITGGRTIHARPIDGSQPGWTNKDTDLNIELAACATNRGQVYEHTLVAANIVAGYEYKFILEIREANRDITLTSFTIRYYIKRSI